MKTKTYILTEREIFIIKEALDTFKHDKVKPAIKDFLRLNNDAAVITCTKTLEDADPLLQQFKNDYSKM